MLNNEEKQELKRLADSSKFRNDMEHLSEKPHNPFVLNDAVDIDKFMIFLTEFNQFINHNLRPFHKIIDTDMRL